MLLQPNKNNSNRRIRITLIELQSLGIEYLIISVDNSSHHVTNNNNSSH
jgi:hypothetical protein